MIRRRKRIRSSPVDQCTVWANLIANLSSPGSSDTPEPQCLPAECRLSALPLELLEEIVSYLPKTAILNLGATSKSFGPPFRYRYLFSGTESFPVQTFRDIAAQPVLGDYAREMTIDLSFLNPPLKDQWYLDGENVAAKTTAWEVARSTKAALISKVLNATRRIRSLTIIGEDGARLATDKIAAAVTRLGRQSLRRLELTPAEGSLLDKLGNDMSAIRHLVLTGGVYDDIQSSRVVNGLEKLPMLQSIHFIEAERPEQGECKPLFNHLQTLKHLEKVSITDSGAFSFHNIRDLLLNNSSIKSLILSDMFHHSVHPPFQLTPNILPETGAPLFPNLTSFVYVSTGLSHSNIYSTHDTLNLSSGFTELVRFLEQCPNLQVFSICNTPLYKLSDEGYPTHAWCPPALVDLLVRRPLKSLTLMGLKIRHDALQRICESCPRLLHLSLLVDGDARSISSWSQHFSKLPDLLALDVALTLHPCLTDIQCPCGHSTTAHMAHIPEGSGMGRLTRRFGGKPVTLENSTVQQQSGLPEGPALVRLTTQQAFKNRPEGVMRNVEGEFFWVGTGIAGEKPWTGSWRAHQNIDKEALERGMRRIEDRLGLFPRVTDCEDAILNPATWVELTD